MSTTNIDGLFQKYFSNLAEEFSLKDFQKSVVSNVLKGDNTLCIMPMGGDKSLIYWLSGLALGGITIVVSPLIAFVDKQAEKIREHGYEVLVIHGGISADEQADILKKFGNEELNPDFIFVSTERVFLDGLLEYCIKQRKDEIKLMIIDEAHCISQWGISFKPFYRRIPIFLNEIYGENNWEPKILASTATLNPKTVMDICTRFKIKRNNIIKDALPIRREIALKVAELNSEKEKEKIFWKLLKLHKNEKVLVYAYRIYRRKRSIEDLVKEALEQGFKAAAFHGDMSVNERQDIITKYKNNEINIVFVTDDLGMEIDIPDIKIIIHFMIPESIEQYYREIGKAARNIKSARAYLLYNDSNIRFKKTYFIDKSFPSADELYECYNKIAGNKTGLKTLQYYDDEQIQKCLPYFVDNGLIKIKGRGISNLNIFPYIQPEDLVDILSAIKSKSIMTGNKKTELDSQPIMDIIYSLILEDKFNFMNSFDKCLIVEVMVEEISEDTMEKLIEYIDERRKYRYKLMDYFIYLIEREETFLQLHQEIGYYLGVPKHKLDFIHSTLRGDKARTRTDAVIANTLYQNGIDYEYEKPLYYDKNKSILPDFIVYSPNGEEIYWEHFGMMGREIFDEKWLKKLQVYKTYFPGQLVKTYEGAVFTDETISLIRKLVSGTE